jgi:hypothetical protein
MSCLDATFTLTPRSPSYSSPSYGADLNCYGCDFWPYFYNITTLFNDDVVLFDDAFAADPSLDYSQFANRRKSRFLDARFLLGGYPGAAQKQLALIFGFDASVSDAMTGRVLIYTDAGLIRDQMLDPADNQFLIEIESIAQTFNLYFIHAGGYWFFKGLSGYVV